METSRSSNASDHLQPPPSPYPSTVDPSPVDSNGTSGTEVRTARAPSVRPTSADPHMQIEDDAQVNQGSEDEGSDINIRSPLDDIISPVSLESQTKVCAAVHTRCADPKLTDQVQPSRLNTSLAVRARADSDEAPQSVIHAPANFQTFVRFAKPRCTTWALTQLNRRGRACPSPRQTRRRPTTLPWCLHKHQKQT